MNTYDSSNFELLLLNCGRECSSFKGTDPKKFIEFYLQCWYAGTSGVVILGTNKEQWMHF